MNIIDFPVYLLPTAPPRVTAPNVIPFSWRGWEPCYFVRFANGRRCWLVVTDRRNDRFVEMRRAA